MLNHFAIPNDSNINTLNDLKEILNNERCDFNNTISTNTSEINNYYEITHNNFIEKTKSEELFERDVLKFDKISKKNNKSDNIKLKEKKIYLKNKQKIQDDIQKVTQKVSNDKNTSNIKNNFVINNYFKYIWEVGDEFSELHSLCFI